MYIPFGVSPWNPFINVCNPSEVSMVYSFSTFIVGGEGGRRGGGGGKGLVS